MKPIKITCTILLLGSALAACSTPGDNFIFDGPRQAGFDRDLALCKQVAEQRKVGNTRTIAGAVIGGLAGAADAKASEEGEAALIGAVVGAGAGRLGDTIEVAEKREEIVLECLQGRGHKVVGRHS